MKKLHDRLFTCGGSDYIGVALHNTFQGPFDEKMEALIRCSSFLEGAPFLYLDVNYRYVDKHKLKPRVLKIDKDDGCVGTNVEFDYKILQWADWYNAQLLDDMFYSTALQSAILVGEKYDRPTEAFKDEWVKLPPIPETIEECEAKHNAHPENHLVTIYRWGVDKAQKELMHILNQTSRHDWLKAHVHKIPRAILEDIITARLAKSRAREADCQELLDLHTKRNAR